MYCVVVQQGTGEIFFPDAQFVVTKKGALHVWARGEELGGTDVPLLAHYKKHAWDGVFWYDDDPDAYWAQECEDTIGCAE